MGSYRRCLCQQFDSETADDIAQLGDEALRLIGERNRSVPDPADLDALVDVKRHGGDRRVQVAGKDAGRDGVTAETDHEVEDGGPVAHPNVLLRRTGRENFFGEVERAVSALVECEPWQVFEIVGGGAFALGERIRARNEDVRGGEEQRFEGEPRLPEQLVDDVPVEVVPVENTKLAAECADIFDDVPGAGLTEGELVLRRI